MRHLRENITTSGKKEAVIAVEVDNKPDNQSQPKPKRRRIKNSRKSNK